ncbi:ATP-dependent DNA helicase 2 subunit 2 [Rhodotorula toruloides]|uniref:ATP-dependent DNA helicase II subunit 2 n=1 Tax=Rhodotorula toruloides TaxID=5286 RepID=A0A511KBH2_RHOTO|nr:ATP-dependent DNA helicase 2 subunit 2 [Rhodotorula toruloides]
MALAPRTASLFLVDCSASMNRVRDFEVGYGEHKTVRRRSGLDVAKEYVKAKIVQRIMRDLKTTPFGAILFGHPKTKNILTTRAKEQAAERDEKFDRSSDPYRHCYELLPLTATIDRTLLDRVDEAVAGEGPDGDAFTSVILAIETLDAQPSLAKYATKEIFVLTDGESQIDWDGLSSAAKQMNAKGISLTVIGMDFDDEEIGFVEANKLEVKRENESQFHQLVERLEAPSAVVNARQALEVIATPQVKAVNSRADRMRLSFGNPETHPDTALVMWVDVKKAIVPAAPPSMKKMSMRGFEKARTQAAQQSQSQSQRGVKRGADGAGEDEDELDEIKRKARFAEKQTREHQAQLNAGQGIELGKIGVLFDRELQNEGLAVGNEEDADLASHAVEMDRRFFYRPVEQANNSGQVRVQKKPRHGGETDEEDEDDARQEEEEGWQEADASALVEAYHYGGSLIPVGDLEDDIGTLSGLETGMEILRFLKQSDIRYEQRMGDAFYVYATPGELGSERTFSALCNAMYEKKSAALVRFVKKGFNRNGKFRVPDPMLGILFPRIDDDEQREYCYWVRFPFAEDIRPFQFPSLERIFNRKQVRKMEHKFLPTDEMDEAMKEFVDAMDITQAGEPDEEGNPTDFFTTEDSFSPAIHNVQNTLVFRLSNPDADLPPVPPILTKYMDPPSAVAAKAAPIADKIRRVFDIQIVPPKPTKINKRTINYAQPGDDDRIDLDVVFGDTQAAATVKKMEAPAAPLVKPESADGKKGDGEDEDLVIVDATNLRDMTAEKDEEEEEEPETEEDEPATEDEDEDATPAAHAKGPAPSIQAIEAAVARARRFVENSFSTGGYKEASKSLKDAREMAQRAHAETTYNKGLRSLVSAIQKQPKKRDYLPRIKQEGLGLLVEGETSVTEAQQFEVELAA